MKKEKGQSLVEVTVALSILGIVMLGVITLAINVIGYSIGTKAQAQAVALAQEGLEIMREQAPIPGCGNSYTADVSGAYYYIAYGVSGLEAPKSFFIGTGAGNSAGVPLDGTDGSGYKYYYSDRSFPKFKRIINVQQAWSTDVPSNGEDPPVPLTSNGNFQRITVTVEWYVSGTKNQKAKISGLITKE